jgi:hypothetical protein
MTILANFPIVSQLTQVTSDGRLSENAAYDCVPASIGAAILWYEGKTQWDKDINPDRFKDAAYGEALHNSGTAASAYVAISQSLGYKLYSISESTYLDAVKTAHTYINRNIPVIFTEDDPYADASLGWTHVCVWYGDDANGLTALDPYIAKPIYRSDASWANILRSNQIWIVERNEIVINIGQVGTYFTQADPQHWTCKQTGKTIRFAILDTYQKYGNQGLNGLTFLGLPKSNEIPIENVGTKYQHLAGKGVVVQVFERGVLLNDPHHLVDSAPGAGGIYPTHIFDGLGSDLLAAIEPKPQSTVTGIDPSHVKNFQTALELQAHDLVAKAQALESAIIVPVS